MIRWIRERLGTGARLNVDPGTYTIVDVRHLVDKAGNPRNAILELVDRGVNAYTQGKSVVVACDFGVSRSNAIAAGILARIEGSTYNEAVHEVARATNEREIKLDVAADVRDALGAAADATDSNAVLVTGGSGFLGTAAAHRLSGTQRTIAPRRSELDLLSGALDLDAYCGRERVGTILHLAYPRVYTNAAAAGESIVALRNVLDVCRVRHVRLVLVSGAVVFGGYETAGMTADENTPLLPKGVYGESKFLEEQLVALNAQRGDVASAICRLAPVYGPGGSRPRLIRAFYDAIRNGETVVTHRFRNGEPALDLLYVDDAADALARVVETNATGTYHFGTGDPRTTPQIAELLAAIAGKPLRREEILIDELTSNVVLDSRKARHELDWRPRILLSEGLRLALRV